MSYISSNIIKYGDEANIKKDVRTLNEIIDRQGTALLIDVLAEYIGQKVLKFNLNNKETNNLTNELLYELNQALSERT